MSRIKTFLIGRHQDCDLILDDNSVSRHHAEVVLAPDGRYYLTDCGSSGGTFVRGDTDWRAIRQHFVSATDRLRFGDYEMPASRLECLRIPASGGEVTIKSADDGLDPNKGLMRNPDTGEVIEQT